MPERERDTQEPTDNEHEGGTVPAGEAPGADTGQAPGVDAEPVQKGSDGTALIEELEEERARAAEYLEQAQRARAELINYRRRVEQEMEQIRQQANARLITRLLPVLDDFHRAIEHVPDEDSEHPWLQGMLLIERKFWSVLESEGVEPIDAVGKPFDPSLHEAVTVEEGAGNADTVVEEFQRGYTQHGRVIRPSMVKVGQGKGTATGGR